jgi:peptidylprolyl isomerase
VQGPSGQSLPPKYTIFGQVTNGLDVVNAIASVPVGGSERSAPLTPVKIQRVIIQES